MPSARFLWRSGGFQKGNVKKIKVHWIKIINNLHKGVVEYIFIICVSYGNISRRIITFINNKRFNISPNKIW